MLKVDGAMILVFQNQLHVLSGIKRGLRNATVLKQRRQLLVNPNITFYIKVISKECSNHRPYLLAPSLHSVTSLLYSKLHCLGGFLQRYAIAFIDDRS